MDNLTPITREEILMNDEPLTPITREEKILAGEDLNPVTRREYFLKKYRHAGGDVMVEGLEVTENGTYTAPEGKAYSPVEVNVPMPENAYLLKEAIGSLVSFGDGADLPMPSFICNIDAVQDLHGQDAPWVGGAGKNKFPLIIDQFKTANTDGTWSGNVYTLNGVTFTVLTDSNNNVTGINADGTATDICYFYIDFGGQIPVGDYYANGGVDGGGYDTYDVFFWDRTTSARMTKWDGTTVSESIFNSSSSVEIKVPNTTDSLRCNIRIRSGIKVEDIIFYPMIRLATETDPTFAPYENICPISGHTGLDAVISPTTEASAGTTYSVSWQTEAGEVFGGYVDLVSGVLTVDRMGVTYSDTNKKRDDGSFRLYPAPSNALVTNVDNEQPSPLFICDKFKFMSIFEVITTSAVNVGIGISKTSTGFYIKDTAMLQMTLEEAKTYLSTHPIDVVYPLETPQTYQLTPTQIKSLLGNNNAWCSTGDVAIDYFTKEVTE